MTVWKCHSCPRFFAAEIWLREGSPCVRRWLGASFPNVQEGQVALGFAGSLGPGSWGGWDRRELGWVLAPRMNKVEDEEWPGHFSRCG